MEPITHQQYWAEIRDIAREIVDDADEDKHVAEYVDGHQWLIYTYYNMQVLPHSNNENAYFDECGTLTVSDFSSCVSTLATWAMMADVNEAVYRLKESK